MSPAAVPGHAASLAHSVLHPTTKMLTRASLTSSPVHPLAEAQGLARAHGAVAAAPAVAVARTAGSPGVVDDHAPSHDRGAAFAHALSGRGPTVTESSTRQAQAADLALCGAISTMSALARRPNVDGADLQRAARQLGYTAEALSGLAGQGRLREVEPTVAEALVERLGALEAAGARFAQVTARVRQEPRTKAASAALVQAEAALSRLQVVAGELAAASSTRPADVASRPAGEISIARVAAEVLVDAERALERGFGLLAGGDTRGFEAVLPEVRERVGVARAGIAQATLGDEPASTIDVQSLQLAHAQLTRGREVGAWGGALRRVLGADGKLTSSTSELAAQLSLPEAGRAALRSEPGLVARLQPHLGPLVRDLAVVLAARDRVMSLAGT
jgi:hypothetical protein